jgi:hypothetical protein
MPATVTMWDAVDVSAIPPSSSPIGVYVDPPPYINTVAAVTAAFPNAQQVSITASGVPGARIGDSESGNMNPTQLAQWDANEIANDRRPTNYCSISAVQSCVDAINALRLPLSLIDWFPADWNGTPHIAVLPGLSVVGTQYANPTYTGADYDLSLVLTSWLNPTPLPPSEDEMDIVDTIVFNGRMVMATINEAGNLWVKSQGFITPFTNEGMNAPDVTKWQGAKFLLWGNDLWLVSCDYSKPGGNLYRWQSSDGITWSEASMIP